MRGLHCLFWPFCLILIEEGGDDLGPVAQKALTQPKGKISINIQVEVSLKYNLLHKQTLSSLLWVFLRYALDI